jgi:uncharacterized membrane protein YbhN (UPF0104 family)
MLLLLGALVHFAGAFNVLANTRLLDLLIDGGVIRYHDLDIGVVDGLPDLELYLLSQDAVQWRLVGIVVLLYLLHWCVRAFKFHRIALALGMRGTLPRHACAFFYGLGFNILAPFRLGNTAVVEACAGDGERRDVAGAAVYTQEAFVLFEVAAFALLGLALNGWSRWLGELFWGFVILAVAWLILRPAQDGGMLVPGRPAPGAGRALWARLSARPEALALLTALSLLAFLIDDFTPYLVSQAFTNEFVILNVPFSVIQMGVVAGYVARHVSITPGGIGQFEWGFASALYMGGVGFPEAATIALLESVVRHGTGLLLFGLAVLFGVAADLRSVVAAALGQELAPADLDSRPAALLGAESLPGATGGA